MKSVIRGIVAVSITPILLALAFSLQAQTQDTESRVELEEIVVTALRRSTNIQDTPISISALSESVIERLGANEFSDFAGAVPGLSLRDNGPGQTRPVIRGIQGVGEAQVGVYYDEIPLGGAPGTTNDAGRFQSEIKLFDIDRVEVLRGPQGTLYGSGSMGGTIRVITNKPDSTGFAGKMHAGFSGYSEGGTGFALNGMLNIPIVSNELALRVVAYVRDEDGFIDNAVLGLDDVNDIENRGGRASLRWTPTERLTLSGTVYHQDKNVGAGFHIDTSLDGYQSSALISEPFDDKTDIYNVTVEYEFPTLKFIYSGSRFDREAEYRFASPLAGGIVAIQPQPVELTSHEARLSSTANSLVWTLGVFSQDRDSLVRSEVYTVAEGVQGPQVFLRESVATLKQAALFGEVEFPLGDALSATLGVRYFDIENSSAVTLMQGFFRTPIPPDMQVSNLTEGGETGPTLKANLSYSLNEDLLLYGQFAQGFRAGGANQNVSGIEIPPAYDSDSVDNFELGLRSTWWDGRLTFNSAIYLIHWDDIQGEQSDPTGLFRFTANGSEAQVVGFEAELLAQPNDNWNVSAGLNLVEAELSADSPLNNINGFSQTGLEGDKVPNVPEVTANLAIEYTWTFAGLDAFAYVSGVYTGESQSDYNPFLIESVTGLPSTRINPTYAPQGDHTIIDCKVGVESRQWSLTFYIDNIADKRAINTVLADNFRPLPGNSFIARPRTWGVSAGYSF